MVVGLDLKPLSDETIAQMGFNNHDLWLVQIDATIYGPYETESLKHYVSENEHLFDEANATRLSDNDFKPFWSHVVFQRRKIQPAAENHEGPFWIHDQGLKVGPLSFRDIDKKIEMGLLVMTDHISVDDGETWLKIYEIAGFDRRSLSPDELPMAPHEASFQKAKLALVERLEEPRFHTSEELAEMCFSGQQVAKVIQFKADDIQFQAPRNTEVTSSFRWMLPTAAAVVLTLVTTGYFMFQTPEGDQIVETEASPFYKPKKKVAKAPAPQGGIMPTFPKRTPASTGYSHAPEQRYQPAESRYPTYMETHENFNDEPIQERDPLDAPVTDAEQPQEHSLVRQSTTQIEETLDAAMNGGVEPHPIEEVSDF